MGMRDNCKESMKNSESSIRACSRDERETKDEMAARRIVLPIGSRDGAYDMHWVRHPGDSRIHVNFGNSRGEI